MRLLAFSDIHFCSSWPLVALVDFVAVHDRITQYATEFQPDVVFFCGDRFRARQPKDHVREAADRCMRQLAQAQAQHGGLVVALVGNHDCYGESVGSGNTYSSLRVFGDVMPNVIVVREPGTVPIKIPTPREDCLVHALPSGFAYDRANYGPDPKKINLFVFHGLLRGAVFDTGGDVKIEEGLSLADLDDPSWDLVLGGDVHVPQRFDLKHTSGGYVGSTLRLTAAAADDKRGFLDVVVEKGKPPKTELIEGGGPRIVKIELTPQTEEWPDLSSYRDAVVLVTLTGPAAHLRVLSDEKVQAAFEGARLIKVHRNPQYEMPVLVEGIEATTTPFEDLVAYVRASDRDGLDEGRLVKKAAQSLGAEVIERRGLFK